MSANQPESNANVGRNTSDPSGMQHPNEDGGALPPSSGEDPAGKGSWIAFWVVIALLVLGGIIWWLIASGDDAVPAGVPTATTSAMASAVSTHTAW
ncbi:hypothetical protein [Demequina aurantiaca]|uniref:hypothetical protein n=1 Tax=Demequina aurantiaca TaxID=676200 RepID=UPI000A4495C1|nr:hypothetical protein [Demequina aurantiaca]